MVVRTEPDTFQVFSEGFRGPVRFHFDERISERTAGGALDQAVVVSPRTGRVRVGHGRQSISVDLEGGFRPGLVYRVTLLPVLRDLFNNQMPAPFEVVFSTGGAYNASAVAGTAWDRITAEGVDALEVLAFHEAEDSTPYVARTDTGGVYVFRYLPPGAYRLVAYQDRNRNGEVDRMELQGSQSFQVGGADTLIMDVSVLQPDTTPARLTKATVVDSLTVLLEFDDHLDPQAAAGLMGISLTWDSTGALVPFRVLHEREYVAWRMALEDSFARLDSAEAARRAMEALEEAAERRVAAVADSLAPDTIRAAPAARAPGGQAPRAGRPLPPALPAATAGGGRPAMPGAAGGRGMGEVLAPDGRPLPSRRLVLRLEEPLAPGSPYKAFAGSVVNINGVGGGSGEATVVRQIPQDTASAADSAALGDTLAADTIPPDTLAGDTIPPDTIPPGGPTRHAAGAWVGRWALAGERRR